MVLVALGDHAGAAVAAEHLPDLLPDARDEYLDAAAFLVRCSGMAASDAVADPRSGGPSSRSPTPTGRSSGSVGPPTATC